MSRIYIGNLPLDIRESELDDLFYKYGRIKEIDLKTPTRPPAFAFISFDDYRDAEDAIRGRDGYNFDGYRLRCEFAKGDRGRGGGGAAGGRFDDRRPPRAAGAGGGRRTEYGVVVQGLPRSCSWQDLKDFMRKAGDVVFTDVDKYGDGVVEFSNRDDQEYAVRTLDDTEFKNYNDSSYIRVKFAGGSSGGGSSSRRRDDDDDRASSSRKDRDDDRREKRGSDDEDEDRRERSPPRKKYSDDEASDAERDAPAARDDDEDVARGGKKSPVAEDED